jgi:hypothetical protein
MEQFAAVAVILHEKARRLKSAFGCGAAKSFGPQFLIHAWI